MFIAIDLVAHDGQRLVVGQRTNRPAQGWYFAPGGRIRHGGTIRQAFRRISRVEPGHALALQKADFIGVRPHFWRDNFYNDPAYGTHYIVHAFAVTIDADRLARLPQEQHSRYVWLDYAKAARHREVHPLTRDYVKDCQCVSEASQTGTVFPGYVRSDPV